MHPWLMSWVGGILIGLAASLMLIATGRVAGISGIYSGILKISDRENRPWRFAFLGGLLFSGLIFSLWSSELFANNSGRTDVMVGLGGLLVGFGTYIGSGCTSGHGVCGISRLSLRSVVATATFMAAGIATATLIHFWMAGAS